MWGILPSVMAGGHFDKVPLKFSYLVFFGLYFLVSFLSLAFYAPTLIEEYYPDTPIMDVVNKYLIYYLLSDLVTRFFLQKFPSMKIGHYLTLNIQKSTICKYLCIRSIFSFFNVAPLFFLIPFSLCLSKEHLAL